MNSPAEIQPEAPPTGFEPSFPVTKFIVGVNCAVFLAMAFSGASLVEPTSQQLIRWGANWGPLSLTRDPWRLITSNYVHIGIIHIAFNMWCLWSLGQLAERLFGGLAYFLVYTVAGIAGSVASLWWHPSVIGAGASGAIFGLAGAVLPVLYFGKLPIPRQALQPTMRSLLAFVGYNLLFGLRPGVDNSAHLGGLAGGLILGLILAGSITNREQLQQTARLGALGMAVVLFFMTLSLRKSYAQLSTQDLDPDALPNAVKALQQQDYASAIRNLTIYTRQNPKSAEAQYFLGTAYLGAHQPKEALAAFQSALRIKPDYADAESGMGTAYLALGMQEEADEAFARAKQMR
jgi:membrane associated rhomboid family serine protease